MASKRGGGCARRFCFRASRNGPSELGQAKTFWNSFSWYHSIAQVQSVPAFLLDQVSAGTPLLRQRVLSLHTALDGYGEIGKCMNENVTFNSAHESPSETGSRGVLRNKK